MLKLAAAHASCCTQPRASFVSFNFRPLASLSTSYSGHKRHTGCHNSLPVCGICGIFHPYEVSVNSLIFMAMSNTYVCGHHTIHHTPQFSWGFGSRSSRTFTNCSASLISPKAPLIVRSPSSLVLAACVTQPDAPQRSDEWFALRRDKLTTSTFSTALGFWKGNRRFELWHEKVFASEIPILDASKQCAMEWGVLNEAAAIDQYKSITGHEVSLLGFAIHSEERLDWLGASPDGLLNCFPGGGVLEVKCPYNKGKPETGLPWSNMPFYYMPQVQGQLEIMDREWADLYCWTTNGSTIFRVNRDRGYWQLIHGILREFWWENVIPAREAFLLGMEEQAKSYKPASKHKQTGLVISKSIKLATDSKLLCREIAGHVEFYR